MLSMGIKLDRYSFSKRKVILSAALFVSLLAVACSSAMCPSVDRTGESETWYRVLSSLSDETSRVHWSADGNHLVVLSGPLDRREVYAVRSDGSSLSRISPKRGTYESNFSVDISPDGSRVVYGNSKTRNPSDGGNLEVWISQLDGSDRERIIDDRHANSALAWSPGGALIAFKVVAASLQNPVGIYTIAPDGAQERLIVSVNTHALWESEGIEVTRFDWGPVWSPDGNALAFAVYGLRESPEDWQHPNHPRQSILYTVEADGLGLKRLFADPEAHYNTRLENLTWSPDGQRIAFSYSTAVLNDSYRDIWDTKLYIVGRDGDGLQEIPVTSELVSGCAWVCTRALEWSPDGTEILLGTRSQGVYSIRVEDFEIRKVAETSADSVAWSPDGSRIALLSENPDAVLMSMQRDGADVRVLARTDEDGRLVPGAPG